MSKTPFNTAWVAEKSTATFWNIAIDDGPHSQVFASVHENEYLDVWQDEAEQLARMIAATPDVMKALAALLPEIDAEIEQRQTSGNDEYWQGLKALSDQAHAALRKAGPAVMAEHGKQEAA